MKSLCLTFLFAVLSAALAEDGKTQPSKATETKKADVGINAEFLCQHWVHSREEEQPGDAVQVYRPSTFKQFPPSRFRMSYVFAKDGTCKWMFLSPSDGHHFKAGKWKIDPADKLVLQIFKGEETESYNVMELTKDLLHLKPVAPAK